MTQFLDTLLAWSGQIFILVAVAAFAAITITHPKARLLFWQGILLLAILIPAIEPRTPTPIYLPSFSISTQPLSFQAAYPSAATTQFRWQQEDWLLIIAAGMALDSSGSPPDSFASGLIESKPECSRRPRSPSFPEPRVGTRAKTSPAP